MRMINRIQQDPNFDLAYIKRIAEQDYNVDDYIQNLQWRDK